MNIRLAKLEDLETIQKIYRRAKAYMVETGNPNQWLDGYPTREMLEDDIACRHLYVMEEDGHLYGAFAFIMVMTILTESSKMGRGGQMRHTVPFTVSPAVGNEKVCCTFAWNTV